MPRKKRLPLPVHVGTDPKRSRVGKMKADILLISNVGFAHGWVPSNIVELKDGLDRQGYSVELGFYSVEFTCLLAEKYPELLEFDRTIGEWEYCFHEFYFSAGAGCEADPEVLVVRAFDLQLNSEDIFSFALLPHLSGEVSGQLLAGYRRYGDSWDVLRKRLLKYCRVLEQFLSDKLSAIDANGYPVIGFSCNNAQVFVSYWLIRQLRRNRYRPLCVMGGPMFTDWNHEHWRRRLPGVDYLITGPGGPALAEILRKTTGGRTGLGKPGEDSPPKNGLNRAEKRYKAGLVEAYKGISDAVRKSGLSWTFQTWLGRNCSWGKCAFCADMARPRATRNVDDVVAEISTLNHQVGAERIGFAEPDVNGAPEKFEELLLKLLERRNPAVLWGEMNARNVSKKIFKMMKAVGFLGCQVGIESLSNSLLAKMRKPSTVLDNIKFLKWSRDIGLPDIYYNLISHFPLEDENDLLETIRMIELIPHLLTSPTQIAIAEFELLYPAKISDLYPDVGCNYAFFALQTPEIHPAKFPHWRRNPALKNPNPLWVKIVKKIHDILGKECALVLHDNGESLTIDDSRRLRPVRHVFGGLERKLILLLGDQIMNAGEIIAALNVEPSERITGALHELAEAGLLYCENGYFISLVNDPPCCDDKITH